MEIDIKGHFRTISNLDGGKSCTIIERFMREIGKMGKNMGKGHLSHKTSSYKENGRETS